MDFLLYYVIKIIRMNYTVNNVLKYVFEMLQCDIIVFFLISRDKIPSQMLLSRFLISLQIYAWQSAQLCGNQGMVCTHDHINLVQAAVH